jgi:hypothetical protein
MHLRFWKLRSSIIADEVDCVRMANDSVTNNKMTNRMTGNDNG